MTPHEGAQDQEADHQGELAFGYLTEHDLVPPA